MIQNEGLLSFYKGYSASLILCSLGVMQMVSYEAISLLLKKVDFIPKTIKSFISGATGRLVASTIFYPFVLVRSRLQQKQYRLSDFQSADPKKGSEEVLYKSLTDCFTKTWKREGFFGFYKGYLTNIVRTVPQQGIFFVGYETTIRLLNRYISQ